MMVGAIIPNWSTPITVHRATQTVSFVNGIEQPATSINSFTITRCCVQPMGGRERQVLPELIRDRELIKIYNQECQNLRSVDVEGKKLADRIDWQDQEYVVQSVDDWTQHGGFYKFVAVKEND